MMALLRRNVEVRVLLVDLDTGEPILGHFAFLNRAGILEASGLAISVATALARNLNFDIWERGRPLSQDEMAGGGSGPGVAS
jgi:hypothetical protein